MRQTLINGYVLHQRAYQEKRAIYRFFSYEFGVVHGVGARGMPLFSPLHVLATGQQSLKTFSQIALGFGLDFEHPATSDQPLLAVGRTQYALLYLNEVLCRLLPLENPCPALWQAYQLAVQGLQALDGQSNSAHVMPLMRAYLRRFEWALFEELGAMIDFEQDGTGAPIRADCDYRFMPDMGFLPLNTLAPKRDTQSPAHIYSGRELLSMQDLAAQEGDWLAHLDRLDTLHRSLMDHLLDYKPLNSRKLWQQSRSYLTNHS